MMENETLHQTESLIQTFKNQIEFILAMVARPVVQQQFFVLFLILFISFMLPAVIRRWRRRHKSDATQVESAGRSRIQRLLSASYYLVAPLLALLLLGISIHLYAARAMPDGILKDFQTILRLWIIYRLAYMLLYAFYGEASGPYRRWIVTPLFVILVIAQLYNMLPGSVTLVGATIHLGTITIPFGNLLSGLLVLYLFIVAGWVIRQMMMRWLPNRVGAEEGVIASVATITRYVLLAVGVVFSLSLLGLDFTSLAIIAGGLSVGIGIGLQDYISNFVGGLVLLFEQTLRPGDVVEIDDRLGRVQKISLRATTIRTLTNQEVIIPNTAFTTQQVTNLTKSDRVVRIDIPLSVSYGMSPDAVREVATESALQHPLVLPDPPPALAFRAYGESSLDFILWVSVNQPDKSFLIRSDLYYLLWNVFEEHGIDIPFPQCDLNLGSGWDKVFAREV